MRVSIDRFRCWQWHGALVACYRGVGVGVKEGSLGVFI